MIEWVRSARGFAQRKLSGRTKVKSSIYYASSSVVCQALRFVGVILSTRLIGAGQFGLFAEATLVLSFTMLARDVGQNYALVSYGGTDLRYGTFNFQINLVLGTCAAFVLIGILKFFPGVSPPMRQAAWLLMGITFCETMVYTVAVLAQRDFRFRLIAVGEISAVVVYLAAMVLLIHHVEGFLVLLIAQLAEGITRLLVVGSGLRWRFVGWADGEDLRHYYFRRKTLLWITQNLLQTVCNRIDYLLLSGLTSLPVLGVYDRVSQFVRIPMSLSVNLLDRVLAASYSREQNTPEALWKTLRKARVLLLLAATGAAGLTTLGLLLVIDRLIGPEWAATILHSWWAAIPFAIIVPLVWNNNILLQSTGNPRGLIIFTVCTAAGELALGSAALWLGFGVGGMFAARAVVWLGVLCLQTGWIRRLFDPVAPVPPLPAPAAVAFE